MYLAVSLIYFGVTLPTSSTQPCHHPLPVISGVVGNNWNSDVWPCGTDMLDKLYRVFCPLATPFLPPPPRMNLRSSCSLMFFGFASLWSIWSDLKASRSSSSSSDDSSSSTGSRQLSWLRTSLLKWECERVFLLLPYGTNFLKDFSILRKSHSKLLFRFWKALNYK